MFVSFRVIPLDRFVFDKTRGVAAFFNMPKWGVKLMEIQTLRQTYAHGIGRHTKEELYQIMRTDLDALSNFMGKLGLFKHYLYRDVKRVITRWRLDSENEG